MANNKTDNINKDIDQDLVNFAEGVGIEPEDLREVGGVLGEIINNLPEDFNTIMVLNRIMEAAETYGLTRDESILLGFQLSTVLHDCVR